MCALSGGIVMDGKAERIEFDDESQFINYDRLSAYLTFSSIGARSELSASVGVSRPRSRPDR